MIPFVNVHTHHSSLQTDVISLRSFDVNEFKKESEPFNSHYTVGLHPWYISSENYSANLSFLEKLITENLIVAIGECGLDKLLSADYQLQIEVFKQQVFLSEKYKLPLIIHQVKSHDEIIKIKQTLNPSQPWIIHGMRLKWSIAESLLNAGLYLSFGHHLLKKETHLTETFLNTPHDKIFLETDNSLIAIDDIFVAAAEIKSIAVESMKEIVYQNFKTVFK